MEHTPEDKRFFEAEKVFEVKRNEFGQLELHEITAGVIRPIVVMDDEDGMEPMWAFCQVVNGSIEYVFTKEEIAFIPTIRPTAPPIKIKEKKPPTLANRLGWKSSNGSSPK